MTNRVRTTLVVYVDHERERGRDVQHSLCEVAERLREKAMLDMTVTATVTGHCPLHWQNGGTFALRVDNFSWPAKENTDVT